jgi:hypothetical protein
MEKNCSCSLISSFLLLIPKPAENLTILFLVDKEFIEERRRSLKGYLQILCRHPVICETDIIKFFLTFQGTVRILYK